MSNTFLCSFPVVKYNVVFCWWTRAYLVCLFFQVIMFFILFKENLLFSLNCVPYVKYQQRYMPLKLFQLSYKLHVNYSK